LPKSAKASSEHTAKPKVATQKKIERTKTRALIIQMTLVRKKKSKFSSFEYFTRIRLKLWIRYQTNSQLA
jgi:hypothetical protein